MHFDGTLNIFSAFVMAALNDSNDVYTYCKMLKQPDVFKFVEATIKEVMDHEERRHWICVPRSEIPKGTSSFQVEKLSNGKQDFVAMVVCSGESIIGRHMLQ